MGFVLEFQEAQKGTRSESRQIQAWRSSTVQAGIVALTTAQLPDCGNSSLCPQLQFSFTRVFAAPQINDKKLRGKIQHTERLSSEAALAAAKTDQWLLPAEAGTLEAEGMERTWRFSQVHPSLELTSFHLYQSLCT